MTLNARIVCYLIAVFIAFTVKTAYAHEYWLDPTYSSISSGDTAKIDIRNGENFTGAAFPYDGSRYKSITITNDTDRMPYTARLGDYPAIHIELTTSGLHGITVDTQPKLLTYESWQKFIAFLEYHGLEKFAQQHAQRILPTSLVTESYIRSAKTVLQVNGLKSTSEQKRATDTKATKNALSPTNSLFEMILLHNPLNAEKTVSAKLLFHGKPLVGRQVEMFWKGTQAVRLKNISDESGIVTFKKLGAGDYMLNAVHLVEPDNSEVHWLSYWASFTFEL